jgi:hypothetical protein
MSIYRVIPGRRLPIRCDRTVETRPLNSGLESETRAVAVRVACINLVQSKRGIGERIALHCVLLATGSR